MTVSKILGAKGRDIFTEHTDTLIDEICRRLAEHSVGAMVITGANKQIAGIVSERDIVRAIARSGASILKKPVRDIMTRKVLTCTTDETVNSVMSRMSEHRFRHMPVVENDSLCGLISIGDVVKYRIAEIELEADNIRSYIAMS